MAQSPQDPNPLPLEPKPPISQQSTPVLTLYLAHIIPRINQKAALNDLNIIIASSSQVKKPKFKILVDTGSAQSIVHSSVLKKKGVQFHPCTWEVFGITNQPIELRGTATLSFNLGEIQIKHDFIVTELDCFSNFDAILGIDFIRLFSAVIEVQHLKIGSHVFPFFPIRSQRACEINQPKAYQRENHLGFQNYSSINLRPGSDDGPYQSDEFFQYR